jgi:putative phage-type endonuclease
MERQTVTKAQLARAEWLEERKTYLGATDVSAILGLNPYETAHNVWLRKRGLIEEKESTLPMELGIYLEPFIARKFAEKTGYRLTKSKTYRDKKFEFLACNPDREYRIKVEGKSYRGGVELKSVGHWAAQNFGSDGSDAVPEHYLIQVLWQLVIARFDFVHLVALIDNRELRVYTYTLNPELSSVGHVFPKEEAVKLYNAAIAWWRKHMEAGIEPELSGHDADTRWAQSERQSEGYPNDRLAYADDKTESEVLNLRRAIKRLDRAKTAEAERKNRIRHYMAQNKADILSTSQGKFTWKLDKNGQARFRTPFSSEKA